MRSDFQIPVPPFSGDGSNSSKHIPKFNGTVVHNRIKHNRSKMGEAAQNIWNTLGLSSLIFGFIVNFDNIIGWLMGAVGIVWGVIRCMDAAENVMKKRDDRRERRDEIDSKKKFRSLEKDEYWDQP